MGETRVLSGEPIIVNNYLHPLFLYLSLFLSFSFHFLSTFTSRHHVCLLYITRQRNRRAVMILNEKICSEHKKRFFCMWSLAPEKKGDVKN